MYTSLYRGKCAKYYSPEIPLNHAAVTFGYHGDVFQSGVTNIALCNLSHALTLAERYGYA